MTMRRLHNTLIVCAVIITSVSVIGQKTTRRVKSKPLTVETAAHQDTILADQISDNAITFSGFEKTLRATRESVFVTNSLNDTVSSLKFDIEYSDVEGNQLHRLTRSVNQIIPPGETRQLSFRTWDSQHAFYYEMSPPGRGALRATPFRVKIQLQSLTLKIDHD